MSSLETPPPLPPLLTQKHVLFAFRSLKFLPSPYQAEDSNRMTLAYFCLSALALLPSASVASVDPKLSAAEVMLKPEQRTGFIDWVYQQQLASGGFRGSDSLVGAAPEEVGGTSNTPPSNAIPLSSKEEEEFARLMAFPDDDESDDDVVDATRYGIEAPLSPANLIQSYTALLLLGILGDDFRRLDRTGLLRFIARCQNRNGSFSQFPGCPEAGDPRSSYSAFAISAMLDNWSAINVDLALEFLASCERPEGGFAVASGNEPQGGMTYCTIASYSLANRLSSLPSPANHLRWLVMRQTRPVPPPPSSSSSSSSDDEDDEDPALAEQLSHAAGFQGREGKPPDACYSFWCTAALKIIAPTTTLLQPTLDQRWLLACQHPIYGGIAREPGAPPDVYHTYLSLAALSLSSTPSHPIDLKPLCPEWNVSVEVKERMRTSLRS